MPRVPDNDFERLRAALTLSGKPDRVPLMELDVSRAVMGAFLGRPIAGVEDIVEFHMRAGYDFAPAQVGLMRVGSPIATEATTVKSARYGVYSEEPTTREWAAEGRGVIATHEDIASFPWDREHALDMTALDQAAAVLPESMKLFAIVGKVFTAVWMLMGFEGFAFALKESPGVVGRLFRIVGEIQLEAVRLAAAHPAVAVVVHPDDIAYTEGLMVHPDVLREHVFPWYRRMGEVCRAHGKLMIYHSDGDLWPVFDDLIECGFCAVHPLEPKAMDARKVKAAYGDRLCLLGGIELDRLSRGTPEEIRRMSREMIRDLAHDGGYCLGSSNSVTDYVPLENYLAMIDTVWE